MRLVGLAIQLALGGLVVGYVAYSSFRGRIANVFSSQCPDLIGFCFDDVFWDSQPYLFLFLALFYTVPPVVLVVTAVRAVYDPPDERTREQLKRDLERQARVTRAWLASPWWLTALVIGFLLVVLASAVVRMS